MSRDVLERAVVTTRVYGRRSTSRCDVVGQLNLLVAKLHLHDAHSNPEDPLKLVVLGSRDLDLTDLLERQHLRIELHRAVQIGDRHTDGPNCADRYRQRRLLRLDGRQAKEGDQ